MWQASQSVTLKEDRGDVGSVSVIVPIGHAMSMAGMGEFHSDDHYIYYCGQEFHRRNEAALPGNN